MDELFPIKKQNKNTDDILFGNTEPLKPIERSGDDSDTFIDELNWSSTPTIPMSGKAYTIRFHGINGQNMFTLKHIDFRVSYVLKPNESNRMVEFRCFLSNEQQYMLKDLAYIEIVKSGFVVKKLFVDFDLTPMVFANNTIVFRVLL